MMPNTYDTFSQDDAEHFLVAIDKAYSKDISNCSPSSDNGFNAYRKNKNGSEPIKSKIYNAFIKVPELLQWAVLLLGPNVPFTCTVRNFIDDLCNDVECMIIRNKGVDIHWSSMEDGISTLPFLLTAITKQISHQAEVNSLFSESVNKPQLILCVIPNEGAEDYIEEIKRICKKIKITVVFINCSDIANSSSEFRNSLGEEMKEKLIQFLIEQSQEEENKKKPEDDIPKQPKQNSSNKYVNGNNSYNQYNDQDYKSNFNELSSPKYHYSHSCNGNFESPPNSTTKGSFISPLNMGGSMSRSYQYNNPGRMERDRHYHNNYHDDNNTLSPGWSTSKPIYFSKSTNSPSQANASYSSRNNSYSVSPSPHSTTPRRERENTFSSLRNYSYFNGQYYSGSSPINMDKKNYHNNDINYSISNNSDVMYTSENDSSSNKNNKHSRSNTICNGVISTQKESVSTPRKFSGSVYSKSFGNNNYNNYNGNNKLGVRNKFVNSNNKRLSVNYNIGYHDKYNDSQYQYTNPYLEGLNLERNYKNYNSYWEGRIYYNSNNNKNNYPMEYKSYSYNDSKSRNSKYSKKNYYQDGQDGSSSSSSPTKPTFETRSSKFDRKYDIDEETYGNEEEVLNKMNNLKISRSFDKETSKNEVPKYRPPIPPYNDRDNKMENDDMKIFTGSSGYGKMNDDNLSRSVPTKNFFTSKKSNEVNDWNKTNKSNSKYNKYSNNNYYKSKSNDNYYDDNDLDEIADNKKNKKETVYNSTKSSPTRLTIDIKSNLKYRAPTPKNIMEGKYKSISPDSYYNESSKNNDMKDYGSKSNHSPKKETKSPSPSNDTNKLPITNTKIIQSPSPSPVPSVEKYVPPNLRNQNKYGSSSTPNSKSNSFDKPVPSPNLIITSDDKLINNKSSKTVNSSNRMQSELTKEIQAQQELTRNKSPLTIPNLSNSVNNSNIIETKNNVISNNNSLLFNSRRHKANTRTNLNNNYNQTNDDNMGNTYNNPNSINKYYINSVNNFDHSPNYTDSNSESLANY